LSGSTSACTPRALAAIARTAGGGASTIAGIGTAFTAPGPSEGAAPSPVPPLQLNEANVTSEWPLQDFLELGALAGAVPCARLHVRSLLWEWGLSDLSDDIELLVSELVTNATQASSFTEGTAPVRLWLLADGGQVLILVWDASPHTPARPNVNADDESGRGLLLVETISDSWGYFPHETCGKVVWALTRMP